jgi:hypothetical protein
MRPIPAVYTSLWWKGPWACARVKRQQQNPVIQLLTKISPVFLTLAMPSASGVPPAYNFPYWLVFTSRSHLFVNNIFARTLILLLLLSSGIHPNPGPVSLSTSPLPIILQINCNGLLNSIAELDAYIRKERISIVAIQDTFLSPASVSLKFQDYTLVRKDRLHGRGGGFAFLVHHSIPFVPVDTAFVQDGHTECSAIKATINGLDLTVFNKILAFCIVVPSHIPS